MNCLNCKKEFVYRRATAKFCSAACRLKYHRMDESKKPQEDETLPDISLEESAESVSEPEVKVIKTPSDAIEALAKHPKLTKDPYVGKHKPFDICPVHRCFFRTFGC